MLLRRITQGNSSKLSARMSKFRRPGRLFSRENVSAEHCVPSEYLSWRVRADKTLNFSSAYKSGGKLRTRRDMYNIRSPTTLDCGASTMFLQESAIQYEEAGKDVYGGPLKCDGELILY